MPKFVPKVGTKIILPNGRSNPSGDLIVEAVGPEVPATYGIVKGSRVFLRDDHKSYPAPMPNGTIQPGYNCLDYRNVIAVLAPDETALVTLPMVQDNEPATLTDAQIDKIAGVEG